MLKKISEQWIFDQKSTIPVGIIGITDFQSKIYNSDRNCGFPIENPLFRSTIFSLFFLTFNYEKVLVKTKILQSSPEYQN